MIGLWYSLWYSTATIKAEMTLKDLNRITDHVCTQYVIIPKINDIWRGIEYVAYNSIKQSKCQGYLEHLRFINVCSISTICLPSYGIKPSTEHCCPHITAGCCHACYCCPRVCTNIISFHRREMWCSIKPSNHIDVVIQQGYSSSCKEK